ncbi:MAG TPA: phenylalanine--tRNA ligase subunit alpha [Candidatus Saccharibacteria bacterium]|nr:phenylalanine--tRNA ligase subunit alpha [Candidatus Saccharibacteria bacterium]
MSYEHKKIADVAKELKEQIKKDKSVNVLRSAKLKALASEIPQLMPAERASFGKELNQLKAELEKLVANASDDNEKLDPIDVTAPFDANAKIPTILPAQNGSKHPLMREIEQISDIFYRMGFNVEQSRLLDDDYHMFDSLNFPKDHPARDDYDTFMTTDGLIAPAHTSTMQNRLLKKYKSNLANGRAIAVLVPDRVFRNEDLDARHEHTFYQHEGIYVDKGMNAGNLIATLKNFLQEYYQQDIEVKTQPFYFPFTEPSFEFALSCPFCKKKGCSVCSRSGWIELLGCGMIHPNVLKMAGIDPREYTGFAWGGGVDRLVMMKSNIEDVRHFESGKLDFLRQFS